MLSKVYFNLTQPQMSIWQIEKVYPGTSFGNIVANIFFKGDLELGYLDKAINIAVEKSDGFRIRVFEEDEYVKQYIADYEYFKVDYLDFSIKGGEADYQKWCRQKTEESFKLNDSNLFYFAIFKTGKRDYGFYIKVHHIISDGWSIVTQASKIVEYYSKLRNGIEINRENEPSYIDFIKSEEEYFNSGKYERDNLFWSEKFKTVPEFVNFKSKSIAFKNLTASRKNFLITRELTSSIHKFCELYKCSPFIVFLSALFAYINRITSKSDIVIGTPVLNRTNAKEKEMAGMFVSAVPVRFQVDDKQDFITFANSLSKEWMTLLRHQKYPLSNIQKEFRNIHKVNDKLIDVVISYQNFKLELSDSTGDIKLVQAFNGSQTESLQIHISDRNSSGEYLLEFDYLTDMLDDEFIEHMGSHLTNLLSDAMANPSIPICDLNILSKWERELLLADFNNTEMDFPYNKTIQELFEEQVMKNPESVAVQFKGNALTYSELNDRANSVANELLKKGIKPEDIVGIMIERSVEMIIGVLGVLKAGGAFLPLDSSYPEERLDYILNDSGCNILLTQKNVKKLNFKGELIFINDIDILRVPVINSENEYNSKNLAYVIYTSGSTGNPKGVLIEHRGIANLKVFFENNLGVSSKDRIVQFFSCSFDAFVWEVFMALLTGASLHLCPRNIIDNYIQFEEFINENEISIATLPPSYLSNLNPDSMIGLRKLITAGSVIPVGLMKKWSSKVSYVNAYGPTETAICAAAWEYDGSSFKYESVPIGRPINNTKILIVNKNNKLQPVGVAGELCVSGTSLARGYINKAGLTAERFIPCSYMEGAMMYRTGDLARWLPDGNIEYIGRIDNQVKIRGFRIELGEIEHKLLQHLKIKEAMVIDREDDNGDKYLAAYYVTNGENVKGYELREYLFKKLPEYMVPSYFIELEKMPINNSGKIDRHELPLPELDEKNYANYSRPANEIETRMTKVWQEVLGINEISVNDNIFEYGIDSLTIMQVLVKFFQYGWNISMQDFYEYQTIRELSCKFINYAARDTYDEVAACAASILPKQNSEEASVVVRADLKNILLTGATGFLGIHLLGNILENTQAVLYCLVRGEDINTAENRLMESMVFYYGSKYHSLLNKRIFVLNGDITCERFGLKNQEYENLSSKIDSVIHTAALVKHFGDYSIFEKVNISGTREVINFCILGKARLNHISTISISGDNFEYKGENIKFTENDFYISQNLGGNVYLKSKFEAEKLIFESVSNGLNASIYRIGNLAGRYNDGLFQKNINENRFYNLLKFFIKAKVISTDSYEWQVEFSPVDVCANAVIELAKLTNSELSVYHVFNNRNIKMGKVLEIFNSIGNLKTMVDNDTFNREIEKLMNDNQKEEDTLIGMVTMLNQNKNCGPVIEISNDITVSILEQLGIQWPDVNYDYLCKIYNYMNKSGFIA